MRAFSQLFKRSAFFLYRSVGANRLAGTIPAQISALVKLQYLWALTSFSISEFVAGEFVANLGISMELTSKAQYQKPSQPW